MQVIGSLKRGPIVRIDLILARVEIDGDELTEVIGLYLGANLLLIDLVGALARRFFRRAAGAA